MKMQIRMALVLFFPALLWAEAPSYTRDIQPIFTEKCVACHACYDAPCQLNLGSPQGLLRGASKQVVYDGARTQDEAPTRLFVDAQDEKIWRGKGFFSVVEKNEDNKMISLMSKMLTLGHKKRFEDNQKLAKNIDISIDKVNSCAANEDEFTDYEKEHRLEGMPYAVTGLSEEEHAKIQAWLAAGAPIDKKPFILTADYQQLIKEWESFLNQKSAKQKLVARWLYEHLFLAHLYFSDKKDSPFFELVRSKTAPGKPIEMIATELPNQDPGTTFYYRIRPIQGVLVHKTHITYPLSSTKLKRTEELFFKEKWTVAQLPGYSERERSNPFTTFAAIPAKARYQFMLDNAEYFVRTFIRGPVCRGQIATDVIRDNFWTLFQSPERDLFVTDVGYQQNAAKLLALPGQNSELKALITQWPKYRKLQNQYADLRQAAYALKQMKGAQFQDIWNGDGENKNALLSIFRHQNSASVRAGLMGEIPQTLWLMDYPIFERTYYQLVANFNVFGAVAHQAQTRLYFDLIRHDAEINFLRLLPANTREPIYDDWYQGMASIKMISSYADLDELAPVDVVYKTDNPKKELAERIMTTFAKINARPDFINRCEFPNCGRGEASPWHDVDNQLSVLASKPAQNLAVIDFFPEVTFLRVTQAKGQREVYTILRNRAHSNVAFMLGESLRWQSEKDTLTIYPGILASYPNFIFDVKKEDVSVFVAALNGVKTEQEFSDLAYRFGIRRTHPKFWEVFHDFTRYLQEREPIEAAVLDMSRMENL